MDRPSSTRPYGRECARRAPARAPQTSLAPIEVRIDPLLAAAHEQRSDGMSDTGIVGFSHPDDAPQSVISGLEADFSTVESTPLDRETDLLAWKHELVEQAVTRFGKVSGRTSAP
ncbi:MULTISPECIES: hypothetical protein [Oerskovia]|uniref:Uncharacterized protein n=1 Tax=Oerskovia rustica TaxID=2762237 RepID=A0ABR8RS94_9CELL|nr:hypothetical protein [Oerskovia rustica]MBD7950287.1 hypothetical protein [Oerskovia rustica]